MMKAGKFFALAFSAWAMVFGFAATAAALPEGHAEFLKNGEYQEAFGEYAKIMASLKNSLSLDEYAALEKKSRQEMENSVRQGTKEYGFSELDAWRSAYGKQIDELNNTVVVWEQLKRNPTGIQGYYRFEGGTPGGYVTVQAIEDSDYYFVRVSVGDGVFFGNGQLEGGKITAKHEYDADYDDVLELSFDGDTLRVTELRGSHKGALDGTYLREKK